MDRGFDTFKCGLSFSDISLGPMGNQWKPKLEDTTCESLLNVKMLIIDSFSVDWPNLIF